MKKITMPNKKYKETSRPKPYFSTASGSKCIKESPNKAPAEKLTKNNNILFRFVVFIARAITPINDIELTIKTLIIE